MNRIRQLRVKHGLTMAELGKRVGCSEASISYYELGKREAKYETLLKLAEVLDTSVDYLLGNESTDSSPSPALPLSADETELVGAWRKAGEPIKGAVRKLLDIPAPEDQMEDAASFRSQAG